jgi:hypothetical protein
MQAEKKNLNKREKVLLLLLVVVGLFAGVVLYVIVPFYNELLEKQSEYDALLLNKMQIELSLNAEDATREEHASAVERHREISARFLSESLSSDIGRMLNNLCADHDLRWVNQSISAPRDFDDGSVFVIVSAAMTVRGTYIDLKRLLDTVDQIEYIRISSVSFNIGGGAEPELDTISLNFDVTMMKYYVHRS